MQHPSFRQNRPLLLSPGAGGPAQDWRTSGYAPPSAEVRTVYNPASLVYHDLYPTRAPINTNPDLMLNEPGWVQQPGQGGFPLVRTFIGPRARRVYVYRQRNGELAYLYAPIERFGRQ